MSAAGLEAGIGLGALMVKWFPGVVALGASVTAALLGWILRNRNLTIEQNKEQVIEFGKRMQILESELIEATAQIKELNGIKDKVIVLETKAESSEKMMTEVMRDVKKLLSKTEYRDS